MKCTKCGKEEVLPFRCAYCHQYYCSIHRLPEQHDCPAIHLARSPVEISFIESRAKKKSSQEWITVSPAKEVSIFHKARLINSEAIHLTIGTLVVIGVGYSLLKFDTSNMMFILFFSIAFALSFLAHELAHKIVGLRKGFYARFRLNTIGLIVTAISIFLPIKFIAPGAVVIKGISNPRELCIVALAGPTANILIALTLFLWLLAANFQSSIIYYNGFITLGLLNAYIALFNLIPFGPLDGLKIFSYNKIYWLIPFVASVVLFIIFNYNLFVNFI